MGRKSIFRLGCGFFAVTTLATMQRAQAAQTLDGSLTAGEGYNLISTQVNVTTSAADAGQEGPANEATASNTSPLVQLSNVYAFITPDNSTLNLFIGGSIVQNDTKYIVALQTNNNNASSSLAGKGLSGNLGSISFDSGFTPNAFFSIVPGITTGQTGVYYPAVTFTDLSGHGDTLTNNQIGSRGNNALVYTAVGTGQTAHTVGSYAAPADPGFANASTGLELSIPLTALEYTAGTNIQAIAFPSVGSDTRTDNQVLAPFVYPASPPSYYDYTYIATNRQFNNSADYPGNQFFTIPGNATPEPASLGVLALGGVALLRRRAAKR